MRFVKTVENLFGLPAGFQRAETIESTGTQYIDTGVDAKTGLTIEAKIKYVSHAGIFCGAITTSAGNGDRYYAINFSQQGKVAFTYLDTAFTGSTNLTAGNIYTIKTVIGFTRQEIFVDGVSTGYTTKTDNVDLHWTLGLFALHRGGSFTPEWYSESKAILYYCKIWDGDTLVRDFIPCIDPLGRACLYDLVGKKAYYNQGTGEFTAGRQIIPVEYLESTGDEYIDTGYVPKPTSSYKCNFELTSITTTGGNWFCVFGSVESNNVVFTELFLPRAIGGGDVNQVLVGNHNSTYIRKEYAWAINTPYDFEMTTTDVSINGVNQGSITVDSSITCSRSIYLFARHESNDTVRYGAKAKVRDFQVLENDTLVRDFIPCKDENDVGFMFDILSSTVYENAGTGDFVVGQNKYKMKLRLIKDNVLPTGYTQVEYLESSGTQWIDTGINPETANTQLVDIETNFAILTPGSDQYIGIFGAAVPRFGFYTRYNNMCFGYAQAHDNVHEIEYGKKYNLVFSVTKGSQNATLDGVTVWSETRAGTLQNIYTIGLFCRNYSTPQWINNARIYNLTIAIDGTLVRNFIPALDPTGTPCMYDMVTKTPFYNQGTGTFSYGKTISMVRFIKDIIPREYAAVNYIESTGTQYIDTGIIGTEGVLSEIDVMKTTATTNECFLGTWNSGSARCWLAYAFSNKWYPGYGGAASDIVSVVQNSWTHIKTYITQVNTRKYFGYNVNGTDYTLTGYFTSFTGQNTILIFAMNTNTGANYKATGRIGTCKITKDGVLVRNFIPVVRRIDKVAGMWDTITKQFYGNSGTGNFNYG